jgi:hypothetical protein
VGWPSFHVVSGGVLLSHTVSHAVPSALKGLTSGFGMGPGVSPTLWPPKRSSDDRPSDDIHRGRCQVFMVLSNPPARGWGWCCGVLIVFWEPHRDANIVTLEKECVQATRPISTSRLHTLRCFHLWPINPVVYWGPYPPEGGGRPHLEEGFPLRCFQRLSRPNVANQPCPWQDNWHTRGSSVPVLSY